ncbi:MAG: flagellar protein [Prevotella sp.]|nr:flagellar protein [Prevotella sp.]
MIPAMLISEYLSLRGVSVTTGSTAADRRTDQAESPERSGFAEELKKQLEAQNGVRFSKHAMERLSERNIDLSESGRLDRLNRAVELAGEKGSDDTLVIIDSTAFLVSVRNNKVITTLTADDMRGNVFTNIDSTVIM